MPGPGIVKNLKLRIGSGNMMTVDHDLEIVGDFGEVPLSLSYEMKHEILLWIRMLREDRLRYSEEFEFFGAKLYSVLLHNEIGKTIDRILFETNSDNAEGLNFLRIELKFDEKQQELASWPWEYLFCAETRIFLAQSQRLVLLRNIPFKYSPRPLLVDKPPIRVLFIASSPNDYPKIEFDGILKSMKDLEGTANFQVTSLTFTKEEMGKQLAQNNRIPTRQNFLDAINLQNFYPHVIHFVGHGQYHQDRGQFALTNEDGSADWIDDQQLASWLMNDQDLRLVFFQAGESALFDPYNPYLDFSGLASLLPGKNIPAVIAMQYKIEAGIADFFASNFYEALARALTIEEAVQVGRQQVLAKIKKPEEAHKYAHCLPVLYMNGSGALLDEKLVPLAAIGPDSVLKSQSRLRCTRCGAQNRPSSKFCGNCGNPLPRSASIDGDSQNGFTKTGA